MTAQGRESEVNSIVNALRELREENHFGEQLENIIRHGRDV